MHAHLGMSHPFGLGLVIILRGDGSGQLHSVLCRIYARHASVLYVEMTNINCGGDALFHHRHMSLTASFFVPCQTSCITSTRMKPVIAVLHCVSKAKRAHEWIEFSSK